MNDTTATPAFETYLAQATRRVTIIWASLAASVVIYGVVVSLVVAQPGQGAGAEAVAQMRMILPLVAVGAAAASILLPRVLGADERLKAAIPAKGPVELVQTINGVTLRTDLSAMSEDERRIVAVMPRFLQMNGIISWALAESVAMFGLVLAFMSRSLEDMIPYAGASLALMAFLMPRPSAFVARVRRLIAQP